MHTVGIGNDDDNDESKILSINIPSIENVGKDGLWKWKVQNLDVVKQMLDKWMTIDNTTAICSFHSTHFIYHNSNQQTVIFRLERIFNGLGCVFAFYTLTFPKKCWQKQMKWFSGLDWIGNIGGLIVGVQNEFLARLRVKLGVFVG